MTNSVEHLRDLISASIDTTEAFIRRSGALAAKDFEQAQVLSFAAKNAAGCTAELTRALGNLERGGR